MIFSELKYRQIGLPRGARSVLRGFLVVLACSCAINTASAQTAEEDEEAITIIADEDAVAQAIEDAEEEDNPFARQLAVEPVGAVNAGAQIEEDDPFAAEGIRLGNFTFRPSIEIGLSASRTTSTTDQGAPTGLVTQDEEDIANENALRLLINSDWSRHELEVELTGTLPVSISGDVNDPTYGGVANLRLDVTSATTLALRGEVSATTEDPQSSAFQTATDPVLSPGVVGVNEPTTSLYAGSATLAHDFGGVFTEVSAAIGRLEYSAARLSDDTLVSQSDLNSTDYNFTLRGGYALSGVISPFVEFNYGIRRTDSALDSSGIDRNATRYGVGVGTLIDLGEKFNGEVAVGYGSEKLEDGNFDAVDGVTLAAELNWSPLRGTNVTLNATTEFQPSGLEDIAGSLSYATELGLSHRLASNLTATAALGAEYEQFAGPRADQTTLSGQVGMLYNFNRYMGLTGRLRHEQLFSADPELRGSTSSVFVGLRFQR